MARPKALLLTTRVDNSEMEELVWSLGYDLVGTVYQNRSHPDPRYYLGRGKLEDARDLAKALSVDCVVVNEALKPNQMFNLHDFIVNGWDVATGRVPEGLEHATRATPADALPGAGGGASPAVDRGAPTRSGSGAAPSSWSPFDWPDERQDGVHGDEPEGMDADGGVGGDDADGDAPPPEVFDRVRVILEIFSERARSQEARLQVELAKLQYEAPLVKEFIHLLRKGERPGFLAGGEYEIQQYYDMINRRLSKIRVDLDKVRRERDVRRKHRRRSGFHLVSLAGYTNAGKSTLLRALSQRSEDGAKPRRGKSGSTGADILVENRYFSTLGTKTRRAQSGKREILVTDTVGFIEDLPPWIVKAFHSTLEEIALADVIALVVDASDPYPELARKISSSLSTLWEFDAQRERGGQRRDERPDTGDGDAHESNAASDADAHESNDRHAAADADAHESNAAGDADAHESNDRHAAGDTGTREIGTTGEGGDTPDAAPPSAPRTSHSTGTDSMTTPSSPVDVQTRRDGIVRDAARGPEHLAPIVIVMNKVDTVPDDEFHENLQRLREDGLVGDNWVAVSARGAAGMDAFYEAVYVLIPGYVSVTLELPPSPATEALVSWLHDETDVTDVVHGNVVRVTVEAKDDLLGEIRERARDASGRVLESIALT